MGSTVVRNELQVLRRALGNVEPIAAQLCDIDGTAINLTGLTIVLRMTNIQTNEVVVSAGACTLDDASTGKVSYSPSSGDVDTPGRYAIYFLDTTSSPNRRWPYDRARFILDIDDEFDP